jgi:hypothetical protein
MRKIGLAVLLWSSTTSASTYLLQSLNCQSALAALDSEHQILFRFLEDAAARLELHRSGLLDSDHSAVGISLRERVNELTQEVLRNEPLSPNKNAPRELRARVYSLCQRIVERTSL